MTIYDRFSFFFTIPLIYGHRQINDQINGKSNGHGNCNDHGHGHGHGNNMVTARND
jgi:hypothetical protein